jgi:hypothetical protein
MMEAFAAGALATLIGLASGQGIMIAAGKRQLSSRLSELEKAVPELITRTEVQSAFAQVAQIEAQRQAAVVQQARAASAFGANPGAQRADMNEMINTQLAALNGRMEQINKQFGLG